MEDPGGIKSASLPAPEAQVGGVPESRRKHVMLGLKLFAGLLIIAAPVYLADHFIPGFFGVAFFGVLAATFGWISGGPKVGAGVVVSLSILGLASILLREHTVLLALILLGLGALYGYAASRGVGKAVLQLPILTPYFMMAPPVLFSYPPTVDFQYAAGIIVIVNLAGAWTLLVLHLALGARHLKPVDVPDRRVPLLYGTLLGVISAVVMMLGTSTELKSHWVWVTLTLYVLADPIQLLTWKRMWGRVMGTFAGFGVVYVLAIAGVPDAALQLMAPVALWLCLYFLVLKRPYWQYALFLTVAVVLMNSKGISTLLLNGERFGFTVIGAVFSVLAAYLVKFVMKRWAKGRVNSEN